MEPGEGGGGPSGHEGMPAFPPGGRGMMARASAQDPGSHRPDEGGGPSSSSPQAQAQGLGVHPAATLHRGPCDSGGVGPQEGEWRQGDPFLNGCAGGPYSEQPAHGPLTGVASGSSGVVGVAPVSSPHVQPDEALVVAPGGSHYPHDASTRPSSSSAAAPPAGRVEIPSPAPESVQGHRLAFRAQFVVCMVCGAFASKGARRLKKDCTGPLRPRACKNDQKRALRRDRILSGRHPDTNLPLGG